MRALLLLALLCGCGASPEPTVAPEVSVEAGPLPDTSVYQLQMPLVDQRGDERHLIEFRGRPTLITMFYAHCPMACPMLVADIQSLEAKLSDADRANLQVVLISLDPERDTPEVLAKAVERYDVDATRWTLLRTDPTDVRTIAAVLGTSYRDLPDGEMNHSSILTLLDADGVIQLTIEGLERDPAPLLERIRQL